MRLLVFIPLALLTGACWTVGPGQIDPSRYPWDPVNVRARAMAAPITPIGRPTRSSEYCVVAIEPAPRSGIVFGGKSSANLGCGISPSSRPTRRR